MEATKTSKEEITLTKMSVANLECKPSGNAEPLALCVIIGKVSGLKHGEDKQQAGRVWTCLTGRFRGTNLVTGLTYNSAKLFLPDGIQDVVEEALKGLGEDGGTVKFAMELRSVKAKNPIGYSYQAVNLLPVTTETDELADLQAAIVAARPALQIEAPAPVAEATAAVAAPAIPTRKK